MSDGQRSDLAGRDVVLLASAPWETPGPLNCHHVARRLARDNRVLYVESPGLRTPKLSSRRDVGRIGRRLRSWLHQRWSGPTQITESLHTVAPMIAPFHSSARIERTNRSLLRSAVRRATKQLGFRDPVLWSFLPVGSWLLDHGECGIVYHCVDDYAGNPGANPEQIGRQEEMLCKRAQLIFATSTPLAKRLQTLTETPVVTVPNVAEVEHFAEARTPPEDLAAVPRPRVGFIGNLAGYKVDVELLREIAARMPEVEFVLIGPVGSGDPSTSLSAITQLANVRSFGARPYDEVPAYVHGCDVCIIPFRRSPLTDSAFPLKTFEYLAAGKPVVATPLMSLRDAQLGDDIRFAGGADDFLAALTEALAEDDPDAVARRRAVAQQNSWAIRFPEISSHARAALPAAT